MRVDGIATHDEATQVMHDMRRHGHDALLQNPNGRLTNSVRIDPQTDGTFSVISDVSSHSPAAHNMHAQRDAIHDHMTSRLKTHGAGGRKHAKVDKETDEHWEALLDSLKKSGLER